MSAAERSSRWIPWTFVAGFGIVIAVNGTMATLAVQSWTGLETKNAYTAGLAFNREVEAARRQAELGWQGTVVVRAAGDRLELRLTDRAGAPVSGAEAEARFIRPTQEGLDFARSLADMGNGRYAASVDAPSPGQWDLRLTARRGGDSFRLDQRLLLGAGGDR